jgi:hypothetical protein
MFMDLDSAQLLRPITKWNAVVHDPRRMPELARRAFREGLSGRPGPVHLDIPQDVLAAECAFADDEFAVGPAHYRSTAAPRPDAAGDGGGGASARRGAATAHRRGRRRRREWSRARCAQPCGTPWRAGDSDADGARGRADRQSAFHRSWRDHRRRCDRARVR